MVDKTKNDLKVAPKSVVNKAATHFAEILGNTPQFMEFQQSYLGYRLDAEAQNAIQEFQKKQASLKALLVLNAVGDDDRKELKRLQDQFYHQPSVLRYSKAQEELMAICQEIGDYLSKAIRMDYGASCKTGGCCG